VKCKKYSQDSNSTKSQVSENDLDSECPYNAKSNSIGAAKMQFSKNFKLSSGKILFGNDQFPFILYL